VSFNRWFIPPVAISECASLGKAAKMGYKAAGKLLVAVDQMSL